MRRYLITAALCAALAGCAAGKPAHPGQGSARAAASPDVPAAAFARAKEAWKQTTTASAATVSRFLTAAADDLEGAGKDGSTAVHELRDLASIPETGTTPAQQARAKKEVADLDGFFGTPGLTPTG